MLEMSPSEGGYLNIVPGVYTYDRFAEVTLTATPKPGYQFVYWLGNVTNATTGTTTVLLDSPKMVIAVFERSKFETVELESDYMGGGGEGSSGLVAGGGLSDMSLEEADGAKRPSNPHSSSNTGNFPVPGKGEGDVPVPEPATATLLFAGFLMLAKSRRRGANTTEKA